MAITLPMIFPTGTKKDRPKAVFVQIDVAGYQAAVRADAWLRRR